MRGCGRVDAGLRRGSGEAGPPLGLCTAFGEKSEASSRAVGAWKRGYGEETAGAGPPVKQSAGDRRGMLAKARKRQGLGRRLALRDVWREIARLHARAVGAWKRG